MENSPVLQPADHENREKGSSVHHVHRLRMKKKVLLQFRRRSQRGRTGNNSNVLLYRSHRDGVIKQQLKWTPSYHTVFKCLIPLLLGVVAVKYQAKSEDPSKTHPLQTWSFLSATFIYSLVLLALKQLKNHHSKHLEILGAVALASGVLSTFSLLSLLLPDFPAGLIVLYVSWALSGTIAAWSLLRCAYNWLLTGIKTLLNILFSPARNLFARRNFSEQESPMPQVTRPPV